MFFDINFETICPLRKNVSILSWKWGKERLKHYTSIAEFKNIPRGKSSKWQKKVKKVFHWIRAVVMVTEFKWEVTVAKSSN